MLRRVFIVLILSTACRRQKESQGHTSIHQSARYWWDQVSISVNPHETDISCNMPLAYCVHTVIKCFPSKQLVTMSLSNTTSVQNRFYWLYFFQVCVFKIWAKVKIIEEHMSTDNFHNSLQYFIVSLPKSSLVSLPLVCRKACSSTRSSLQSTSSDLLMKNSLVCVIKLQ